MVKKKTGNTFLDKWGWAVKNVVLAVLLVTAIVASVSLLLSVATQHGKETAVPDFTNLTFSEARKVASDAGVKVIVEDSVFVRRLRPGAVYMQNPKAGEKVKFGRKIRLTTNTMVAKEVPMPTLVGYSLKQAKAELLRNGLNLGRLVYVNDIATNYVLKQQIRGVAAAPGKPVASGTSVNLVLGLNPNDNRTFVPRVIGRQYLSAVDLLHENSLNVGALHFDRAVRSYADSVSAVVYAQKPDPSSEALLMGAEVTLYLTNDPGKVPGSGK